MSLGTLAAEIRRILTSIPNTNMKPILAKILTLSPFVLILGGIGIALASGSPDYPSIIKNKLESADRMTTEAKEASCKYIGLLTNECYSKNKEACRELDHQDSAYQTVFGSRAKDDCATPETPDVPQNPAFFGDGER